jgi:hypothetical protein
MSTSAIVPEPPEQEQDDQEPEQAAFDAEWGDKDAGYPDMPQDKQTTLKNLLKSALQREIYSRRTEVIDARQQRFYARSVQYIYFNFQTNMFAPLFQGGDGNTTDQERYCEVYDIYSAFLRTLVAALSQNPVGAEMVPRTAKRTVDDQAAEIAEQYKNRIEQVNDIKEKQIRTADVFCTDGRVVGLIVDAEPDPKYGHDSNNNPLGAELMEIDGILEWKVPITQEFKDWAYAVRSKELEKETAQDKYPDAVDDKGDSKIKAGSASSGESAYERMARIGVLQGTKLITATGETWEHLVTEHIGLFRPAFYRAAPKDDWEWLKEAFPDGLRMAVTGDAYCGAWNDAMDKRIRVAHCKPGDGQNRTSLLRPFIPIQDAFNDLMNLRKEMHEYCIPEDWMDKETWDLQANQEHRSEPGNRNPVVLQPGDDIRSKILLGQSVQISADLVNAIEYLAGELAQLITAALPALMGSGDEHNETKGGIQIMREQALGQMGIAWGASQQFLAELEEIAIKRAGEKAEGEGQKLAVTIPGGRMQPDATKEINTIDLQAGDFYAEVDTSFPDTRAMRRAIFTSIMTASQHSPALQAMLALPENQELFKEMVDDDLEVPGASARIQQLREIEDLLNSPPPMPTPQQAIQFMAQQVQQAMAKGAPEPPPPNPQQIQQAQLALAKQSMPTVPIDPEWNFHQFHIEVIQDWLADEQCHQETQKGNILGIENVKAHGEAHKQALQAQTPPPQGKPPSTSINFADLPPDGQLQLAKEANITLNPQALVEAHAQKIEGESQKAQQPQGAKPNG